MRTPLEARINEILKRKVFPNTRAWCRAAVLPDGSTVSTGYIRALKSRLRSGHVTTGKAEHIDALARAAGVTASWLMGTDKGPLPPTTAAARNKDPLYGEFTEAISKREGFGAALALTPMRWHMTTVLRAMAYKEPRFIDGEAVTWWRDLMDKIESARVPEVVGNGAAVLAATLVQVDTRKSRRKK